MGKLERFLELYSSGNTRRSYKSGLEKFFNFTYPEDLGLTAKAEKYFNEKRDIEDDIQRFNTSIAEVPPKSSHLYVSAVKNFLMENGIELSERFWKRLKDRRKGSSSRARTIDKVPSNKELKRIITFMPINGKALYLLLASSGMRIGEALQLQLNDLNLENNKVNIRGEYSKTGNSRVAFFSDETKEYLKEWVGQRDDYLKQRNGRTSQEYEGKGEDHRLFAFSQVNAYDIWERSLLKTRNGERDPSTNRRKIHPHVLRKFFRTRMAQLIPVDVVEALMGHEGYLTEVYRRYSEEDLFGFYKKGESSIIIMGLDTEEIGKIKAGFQKQQDILNSLLSENTDLKQEMRETKETLKDNLGTVRTLEQLMRSLLYQYTERFNPEDRLPSLKKFIDESPLEDLQKIVGAIT